MQRPDLSHASPELRAYLEWLEAEVERLRGDSAPEAGPHADAPPLEPEAPPTPFNLITIAVSGLAWRVPRHLYLRQRHGGAGNLDADWSEPNRAVALAHAHERSHLLVLADDSKPPKSQPRRVWCRASTAWRYARISRSRRWPPIRTCRVRPAHRHGVTLWSLVLAASVALP